MEFFLHGTTAQRSSTFAFSEGKRLFTAVDPEAATMFASRTVRKEGGSVGMQLLVLPKKVVARLKQQKMLTIKPVDDHPGIIEYIFAPGAHDTLVRNAIAEDITRLLR